MTTAATLWLSIALASAAGVSALVLAIQRGYYHKQASNKLMQHQDLHRDSSVPFADTRIPRMTLETILLVVLHAYGLYLAVSSSAPHNGSMTMTITINTLVSVSWLYILALVLTARCYRLPNDWGWVLNVHLFILYLESFVLSVFTLISILWGRSLSLFEGIPLVLSVLLTADLVYTTGTMKRGQPFLRHGKPVAAINVSSILGYLCFNWVAPLMTTQKQTLELSDLPELPPDSWSYDRFSVFSYYQGSSLLRRLFVANRTGITVQAILGLLLAVLCYVPSYITKTILSFIQNMSDGYPEDHPLAKGWLLAFSLAVSILGLEFLTGQLWHAANCSVDIGIRSMLTMDIYRKTLWRMNSTARNTHDESDSATHFTTGTIMNLMSTDISRISGFSANWFIILEAPLEIAVGIYFLYTLLGYSCFLGLLVMIIMLPINHYNSKRFVQTQDRLMETRDKRVSLTNELLQGIRQIKFFAWESQWKEKIMSAREDEIRQLRNVCWGQILFDFIWDGTPLLVTIISFWAYTVLQGKELTATVAFTSISVFNILRFSLNVIPELVVDSLQAFTRQEQFYYLKRDILWLIFLVLTFSIRRIDEYLQEKEVSPPDLIESMGQVHIGFVNATVCWAPPFPTSGPHPASVGSGISDGSPSEMSTEFLLKDINAQFPNGEMSLICGATGSGKTLLMLSLLGETVVVKGKVIFPRAPIIASISSESLIAEEMLTDDNWVIDHAVAYVSQTAWLQNASIRDNILFGLPYLENRYKDTLAACALEKDISYWEDGDMTEIGEKGITLSGGQKARVALARAVYSRAKNVLMDDVLSAVDAHTARHLYEKCLIGPLMQNRTRILITHHVDLCLQGSAYLVHIENGTVKLSGSPSELGNSDHLSSFIRKIQVEAAISYEEETKEDVDDHIEKKAPKVLIEEETRAVGSVKRRFYTLYFSMAKNPLYWVLPFLLIFACRSLDILVSWWLKIWAQSYETSNLNGRTDTFMVQEQSVRATTFTDAIRTNDNLGMYLSVYAFLNVLNLVASSARVGSMYWVALGTSKKMYEKLLSSIMRAPLRWFDTIPVGRILNRFSKDFDAIDSELPSDVMTTTIQGLVVVSSLLTISIVLPVFSIPMLAVAVMNVMISAKFITVGQDLRRLDSVSRSPLFSHFSETIVGIATIRAFGVTKKFTQTMLDYVHANFQPFYFYWAATRWNSIRLSYAAAAVNFLTAIAVLINAKHVNAATAGFCLSFVLEYSEQLFLVMRRYTRLEMSFNAVERVVEYMEIDQEAPAITDLRPPAVWPSEGQIHVKDLEVRYATDLSPVLKGVSFSVRAREKVGIVGRTGSGKSTLALSFFRFLEATKGDIVIDNVNIKDIGTDDLRNNLTIIPQDVTLFSGTLRSNIDPFDQFSDDDIFTALRRVHLLSYSEDDVVDQVEAEGVNANVFKDLNTAVSEGGNNFSQGQRQLLCLARALLKRSRVVLMDEATASVDFKTDKAIQKTISTEFADCTILCIAHRLHTVIEYDRILVLDRGQVLEFANPLDLLNDEESMFYKLCRESGEFESLISLAKAKHQLVDTAL